MKLIACSQKLLPQRKAKALQRQKRLALPALRHGRNDEVHRAPRLRTHVSFVRAIIRTSHPLVFNLHSLAALSSVCALSCIQCAAHDFSLLTFNVQNLFDGHYQGKEYSEFVFPAWTEADYQKRLISIGSAIQSLEKIPSVIALQEVENEQVVLELQKFYLPQLSHVVVSHNKYSSVQNALLSRHEIVDVYFHNIDPHIGKGMRDIIDVVLAVPLKGAKEHMLLQVIVVHLKSQRDTKSGVSSREMRAHQYALVSSVINTDMPTIIAGDFNDESPLLHFPAHTITESALQSKHSATKGTYYFRNSWTHIDHVLLDTLARDAFDDETLVVQDVKPFINSKKLPNAFSSHRKDFKAVSDHVPLLFLARTSKEH